MELELFLMSCYFSNYSYISANYLLIYNYGLF